MSRRGLALGLALLGMLALAGPAFAAPATDVYGAGLPSAQGGQSQEGTGATQSNPQELPSDVNQKLDRAGNGKQLKAVATSPELGAPAAVASGAKTSSDGGDDDGFLSSAADTIGDPLILGLIAVLAVATFAAWRFGRRGSPT